MEEIQTEINELSQRIDDIESSNQDLSDSIDTSMQDMQSSLDEQSQTVSDLQETAGQLQFPLTQDTIDLINEQFPRGQTPALIGGTYTLKDGRISDNTIIIHSVASSNNTGTLTVGQPHLYYTVTVSKGQAIFQSSVSTDTSKLNYLILI